MSSCILAAALAWESKGAFQHFVRSFDKIARLPLSCRAELDGIESWGEGAGLEQATEAGRASGTHRGGK